MEEREEALHHLELAGEMGLDGYSLYQLGRIYLKAARCFQVSEALRNALQLCADDDARRRSAWAEYDYVLLRADAPAGACRAAQKALQLRLDSSAICGALFSLFRDAGCDDIAE